MWRVGPPDELTWCMGPADELTWRAGLSRGCDVALRPRGRATSGLREAQWRGHLAGGHADARVRHHVARGLAIGGPRG